METRERRQYWEFQTNASSPIFPCIYNLYYFFLGIFVNLCFCSISGRVILSSHFLFIPFVLFLYFIDFFHILSPKLPSLLLFMFPFLGSTSHALIFSFSHYFLALLLFLLFPCVYPFFSCLLLFPLIQYSCYLFCLYVFLSFLFIFFLSYSVLFLLFLFRHSFFLPFHFSLSFLLSSSHPSSPFFPSFFFFYFPTFYLIIF